MTGPTDNTARAPSPDGDAEPSMDEILASIRQIIADDEEGDAKARAAFTHPTGHSNSNEGVVVPSAPVADTVPDGFEAALSEALSEEPETGTADAAARVRAEIEAASANATPDELLARYRNRGEAAAIPMPAPEPQVAASPAPSASVETPGQPPAPAVEPHLAAVAAPVVAAAAVQPSFTLDEDAIARQAARRLVESQGEAMEGMVREMALPMVRAYMAENLPSLIERLVREEIQKAARGRTTGE